MKKYISNFIGFSRSSASILIAGILVFSSYPFAFAQEIGGANTTSPDSSVVQTQEVTTAIVGTPESSISDGQVGGTAFDLGTESADQAIGDVLDASDQGGTDQKDPILDDGQPIIADITDEGVAVTEAAISTQAIGGTESNVSTVTVSDENLLGHTCLIPSSLGDATVEGIMFGWDGYWLEDNFRDLGINKGIISDQKQYQEWEMSTGGTTTIQVEYLSKNGTLNHTFGYYIVAGGASLEPIFSSSANANYPDTPVLALGGSKTVEIKGPTRIGFGIGTSDGSSYFTHNFKNEYGNDHAVVYELEKNVYILSFEDLPLGENAMGQDSDRDYNDLIVKITVLGCGDNVPPPPPPPPPPPQKCKAPLDVVLTIDRSGSMQGDPLADAKEAAKLFIDNLSTSTDKVGIVSYSNVALLKSPLSSDFAAVKKSFASLNADGRTNIGAGIQLTYTEFDTNARGNGVKKVMVLLSDGVANLPTNETEGAAYAREQASTAKSKGITVYTIGLGSAIDEILLKDIASAQEYYFKAPTSDDLSQIYKQVVETECEREPSSVSGKVINDKNGNAIVDQGEEGVSEWVVTLESLTSQGVKLTATTSATGDFIFDDVIPGDYKLCQNLKSQWQQIYPDPTINGSCYAVTVVLDQDLADKNFLNKEISIPPAEPTVTLTGNPLSIIVGSTTTLSWSSTNTNSCSAVWTSATSTSGFEIVSPATTTEYAITCTGNGGSKTASITITVTPKGEEPSLSVTLTANPAAITQGGSSTLNWSSSNTTYCTADWTSATSTSGSQVVTPASTAQYSISCGGQHGTSSASATVVVNAPQNNGGGGGGGGGGSFSGSRRHPVIVGEVLGATSCSYLRDYLKIDWNNDPVEVLKLQFFLNKFEGENLSFTNVFDESTFGAVQRFQNKYFDDILKPWGHTAPTGFVYITTKKKINEIYCNTSITLSQADQQEINAFRAYIESLGGSMGSWDGAGVGANIGGPSDDGDQSDNISGRGVSVKDIEVTAVDSPVINLEGSTEEKSPIANVGRNLAVSLFSLPQIIFSDWSNAIAALVLLAVIIMAVRILGSSKKEDANLEKVSDISAPSSGSDSPVIVLPGLGSKEDKNSPLDEEIIINEEEEEVA